VVVVVMLWVGVVVALVLMDIFEIKKKFFNNFIPFFNSIF
jgi:hypothetical protein